VRDTIPLLGNDGGYVFNSIQSVQPGVPVENLLAMNEAVKEQPRVAASLPISTGGQRSHGPHVVLDKRARACYNCTRVQLRSIPGRHGISTGADRHLLAEGSAVTRVSIKDIARVADVSHSTVSRALGDSPLVSSETKARIQRLAQEMGYSPDAQARSLVMRRTQTIGVVVTAITDPFIAEIVQAVERTAGDHDFSVILASSNAEPEREIAAVEMLQSKRVDGVIVTSSRVGALYQEYLDRLGVPVVLVNSHSQQRGPYTFSVNVDNHHGGCLATEHLVSLGYESIAYVGGAANHSDDQERLAGYRRALAQAGLPFDPALVLQGNGRASGGERAWSQLLALQPRPQAVFCYNDVTAIGLMRAARQSGCVIPHDLAVVGFDDIPFASYIQPSLTTVSQPKGEMGRMALEMVLALLESGEPNLPAVSNEVVQGRLIVRESTALYRARDAAA
jgi:DNA-binding LacI/PurR family transcriptional regulator